MVRPITMPKLGQSEEVGTLVRWRKKVGDAVAKGDILFEIETDKALLEVESFFAGTLLKTLVQEGATVPINTTVGFVGDPGEAIPEVVAPIPEARKPEPPSVSRETTRPPAPPHARVVPELRFERPAAHVGAALVAAQGQPSANWRIAPQQAAAPEVFRISPRAAKLARESVINPTPIAGTGPHGRIVERDVKNYLESKGYYQLRITPAAKRLAARENIDILSLDGPGRITVARIERAISEKPQPMSRMRQVIASRLTESFTTTPHFFVTVAVDMTELVSFRSELKAQGASYTVTDFIAEAVALSLVEFPIVNSTTDGKNVRWHSKIHLGLAVSLEQGLVVPVIRDAEELSLAELHDCASELVAKARAGKLTPDEMGGSTFTISNMGMLDIENFTAIINPGESAILAVSSTLKQPVVKDGQIVVRDIMKMTLSSDHRIIDGATAARFANAIKQKLEEISLWKRLA
ncbi:MAG TPA: dihydrolipoamide acetyltransferase family protein [Terriglobia bacterium]|nr:dihydrolipoamide acetyltransferase family protein [Terriglobia bacterium]